MHVGTNRVPYKIQKHLKDNTVKELIRGIKKSLPIMKLAAMDQEVREYLLYCMFSLQHQLGQHLVLPQYISVLQVNFDDWSR